MVLSPNKYKAITTLFILTLASVHESRADYLLYKDLENDLKSHTELQGHSGKIVELIDASFVGFGKLTFGWKMEFSVIDKRLELSIFCNEFEGFTELGSNNFSPLSKSSQARIDIPKVDTGWHWIQFENRKPIAVMWVSRKPDFRRLDLYEGADAGPFATKTNLSEGPPSK